MNPEYVRLTDSEVAYGQKWLLESHLHILNISKESEKFRNLRNEELALKIALKNKINETLASLDLLEKILPKPVMKESKEKIPESLIEKERTTLEDEIEEIKRKLLRLRI